MSYFAWIWDFMYQDAINVAGGFWLDRLQCWCHPSALAIWAIHPINHRTYGCEALFGSLGKINLHGFPTLLYREN